MVLATQDASVAEGAESTSPAAPASVGHTKAASARSSRGSQGSTWAARFMSHAAGTSGITSVGPGSHGKSPAAVGKALQALAAGRESTGSSMCGGVESNASSSLKLLKLPFALPPDARPSASSMLSSEMSVEEREGLVFTTRTQQDTEQQRQKGRGVGAGGGEGGGGTLRRSFSIPATLGNHESGVSGGHGPLVGMGIRVPGHARAVRRSSHASFLLNLKPLVQAAGWSIREERLQLGSPGGPWQLMASTHKARRGSAPGFEPGIQRERI